MNQHPLPKSTSVLVVGYGPVGAAVSALLGRYGVNTLVVDMAHDILMMPRAIALDNEALRILQMVGLNDDSFDRIEIPQVKMHCPYMGEFGKANTSGRIDGHPKLVTFYQPDLEAALRRQTEQFDSVTRCLGYELIEVTQNKKEVVATLQGEDGQRHKVHADYLIGADGASSKVRASIGQEFMGESYTEDWLIVDANQREGLAIAHVEFICDPKRPTPHMPAPGGRERWEFMLQPGETRAEMETDTKVAELLSPWIEADKLTIERKAVYRFHARCCKRFSSGRMFLVGDAAHITPPFVGQGLVAGLRDAANLSWKLAWVLKGRAGTKLLKSYDTERRAHAKQMINLAKLMAHLVMPRGLPKALLVHGAMRMMRFLPTLRRQLEELEIKPKNHFKKGFFISSGKKNKKLPRGGQIPQNLLKRGGRTDLSDDVLGDHFTMIGYGVNLRDLLDNRDCQQWVDHGGQFLHMHHNTSSTGDREFVQDLSNQLMINVPGGWIAVVRPDRVIMHEGSPDQARSIVKACLKALSK